MFGGLDKTCRFVLTSTEKPIGAYLSCLRLSEYGRDEPADIALLGVTTVTTNKSMLRPSFRDMRPSYYRDDPVSLFFCHWVREGDYQSGVVDKYGLTMSF